MTNSVNGVAGANPDRGASSADVIAEARQRLADRLRAAQAENVKPDEVVEATARGDAKEAPRDPAVQPYRVNLDPTTRRLYTEVLDTVTGEVIMRIPAGYHAPEGTDAGSGVTSGAAHPSTEFEA